MASLLDFPNHRLVLHMIFSFHNSCEHDACNIFGDSFKGHFAQGVRIKETQELSNPIGGELKIGPQGFPKYVKIT